MFTHGGNEPVAALGHGLDEPRVLRTIAECSAHIEDALLHGLGFDHTVGPHGIEQLLVCHQASCPFDEMLQDGKRLGRYRNALFALQLAGAPETLVAGVETEWREFFHRRHESEAPNVAQKHFVPLSAAGR